MIRLIVSDLDGTLLENHDAIHPENLTALREAMARGVRFAVASGRSAAACTLLLRANGLEEAAVIGTNGCEVRASAGGERIAIHYLDRDAAREALRIFAAHGLESCLYTEDAIVYSNPATMEKMKIIDEVSGYQSNMRSLGIEIQAGPDALEAAVDTRPMKVFCIARKGQDAAFAAAREACAAIPRSSVTSSWHNNFEIMPAGVDKGTALRTLAEHMGIAREEVIAFGDNENDLPMLRWAGTGVAMGNAQALVLREITHTTGRCEEGGVGQGIRRWVLP